MKKKHIRTVLERVQRRAMKITFPGMKYKEALEQGHLQSLAIDENIYVQSFFDKLNTIPVFTN